MQFAEEIGYYYGPLENSEEVHCSTQLNTQI